MYPSLQKPYSGLFVVNQVEMLKENDENNQYDFIYLKRSFTGKIGSFLKYFKFIIKFIYRSFFTKKYDIIHIHYYFPTIYLGLLYKLIRSRSSKLVVTFHGGDIDRYNTKQWWYRFPLKYIDHIIAVSNGLRSKVMAAQLIDLNHSTVLAAGIKDVFYLETTMKDIDLLFVGSFFPYKGLDRFIRLLKCIKHPLNVCIVGSGEEQILLDDFMLHTHHKVCAYGTATQEELQKIYSRSRFLINCSRLESFGLVITEAMACGTPVIAIDTDGAREQLNKNNGFIISGENEEQIHLSLLKSVQNALKIDSGNYAKLQSIVLNDIEKYRLTNVTNKLIKLYSRIKEEQCPK